MRSKDTVKYLKEIKNQFDYLVNYFDFEPGDIFVEIMGLEEFKELYKIKNKYPSASWIVGYTLNNGVVIVLDKDDFSKREGHNEEEFERVILHELGHIFIRRLLWPKQTYIWIEEGICEFISFKDYPGNISNFVDFDEIKSIDGWSKHNSYVQSKEFFKKLSYKFGDKKIVDFIKGIKSKSEEECFKEVFGEELNKFIEEFKTSLENENPTSSRNTL